MDVKHLLYNEKKEEEERYKIGRKVLPIVERTNKNRRDNLTKKERRGMWKINRRNDLVIQAVDKGGAIAAMEKEWYKERKKKEEHKILREQGQKTIWREHREEE